MGVLMVGSYNLRLGYCGASAAFSKRKARRRRCRFAASVKSSRIPAFAFMLCGLLLSCGKKQKMIKYTRFIRKKAQEANGLDSH